MKEDSILKRFLSKVDIRSENECWNWLASTNIQGYGKFKLNGTTEGAHRVAYFIKYGSLPRHNDKNEELFVCHSCDNPSCVNPAHLFLGTNSDNIKDSFKKERSSNKGEKYSQALLTDHQVRQIKLMILKGIFQRKIAKYFNISQTAVSDIKTRRRWKHIN